MTNLRNTISHCISGGTCFLSAFTKLRETIQSSVSSSEYPVVVFVTDGQDCSDLRSIINSILSLCPDLLFFSVGYGSINYQQLHSITNMFNRTSGQQKNINGKQINLFYQNNEPQQLYNDLLKITENKISIEDIKKAKEFFQDSHKSQQQQIKDFYGDQHAQIDASLKVLYTQQQVLQNPITKDSIEALYKACLDNYNQQLYSLIEKNQQENENKINYQNEIDKEKLKLFSEFSPKASQTYDQIAVLQNFDANQLVHDKISAVKEEYHKLTTEVETKIKSKKKEQENIILEKKNLIMKLGFQNESHFLKFFDTFRYTYHVQNFYIDIATKYIDMIDQLKSVGGLVEKQIEFSQRSLEAIGINFQQERVFKYFQKYDDTISLQNSDEAKMKILKIMKSSLIENNKESDLARQLQEIIRRIDFLDLNPMVDADRRSQDKAIETDIIPSIIGQPNGVSIIQDKVTKLRRKIAQKDDKLQEKQADLRNEKDFQKKNELKTEIFEEMQEIADYKQEMDEYVSEISEINKEFQSDNSKKIQIIKEVAHGFIKAIQDASLKFKYFVSVMPFKQFVETCQVSNKSLKAYIPLSLTNN